MSYTIREADNSDLDNLLNLYLFLHEDKLSPKTPELLLLWQGIIKDENYHIFIGLIDSTLVSSCTLVVIKNLTRSMQPYALIENVVTHENFRGNGYATALLEQAVLCAKVAGCYKAMLLTGSKRQETLRFYERSGFNRNDKTGFIKWL